MSWFKGAVVEGSQEQEADSHKKGYGKQNVPLFPAPNRAEH